MIRHGHVLAGLLMLGPGLTLAADADGAFAVKGVGLTRCSDYVAAVQEADKGKVSMYVGWIGGFITATNQNREETFDLTPWQNVRTLSSALVTFCDKNADMRFAEAAARLAASLGRDRIVSRTELVPIEHEGKNHYVYRETLKRMQAELAERGMFSGEVTGEFDEPTRTAIETFQSERNLPVNGLPDQRTLFSLFHRPPAS